MRGKFYELDFCLLFFTCFLSSENQAAAHTKEMEIKINAIGKNLPPIKLFLLSWSSFGEAKADCLLLFPLLFPDLEFFPFACLSERMNCKA